MSKIVSKLFMLGGVLCIVIVLTELLARLIFSQEFSESRVARMHLSEAHNYFLDRKREPFPDQNSSGEYIIFLGDSFVYGGQLPTQSTFPVAYERCINRRGLQYKVLNLGISGAGILDQAHILSQVLNEHMSNVRIKAVVILHSQEDRAIKPSGIHPYELCTDYPYAKYRDLHYKSFLAYHLDSRFMAKDITERCLKKNFDTLKDLTEDRGIKLIRLYNYSSVINENSLDEEVKLAAKESLQSFSEAFPAQYIPLNAAFDSIASHQSLYADDNYHYNDTANAIIGEYLCDKIEL